jgi:hypothetical protein
MFRYSQTEIPAVVAAERHAASLRAVLGWIIKRIRTARHHRRQHQELIDYMASDHRAARDLGIASHEVRNLWR